MMGPGTHLLHSPGLGAGQLPPQPRPAHRCPWATGTHCLRKANPEAEGPGSALRVDTHQTSGGCGLRRDMPARTVGRGPASASAWPKANMAGQQQGHCPSHLGAPFADEQPLEGPLG